MAKRDEYLVVDKNAPFRVLHRLLDQYKIPYESRQSVRWLYDNLHTLPLLKREQKELMVHLKSLMFDK